ncbi:glycosyltransferase [Vibrio navarrensis]|nr:glycosyltransferase [Vibrio navarrensis]
MRKKINDLVVVMLAYNHESYVKQSILSIFDQTVLPEKLIILDDASQDSTQEIIKGLCENAPFNLDVELRLNKKNQGLPSQLSSIKNEFKDVLIVFQACDDVALSMRLEVIYGEWVRLDKPSIVHSSYYEIDCEGNRVGEKIYQNRNKRILKNIINRKIELMGCAVAVHSDVINFFPSMSSDVGSDDRVLLFRAALVGTAVVIKQPLLEYRINVGMSFTKRDTANDIFKSERKYLLDELADLNENRRDAEYANNYEIIDCIENRKGYIRYTLNEILMGKKDSISNFRFFLDVLFNVSFRYWPSAFRRKKRYKILKDMIND